MICTKRYSCIPSKHIFCPMLDEIEKRQLSLHVIIMFQPVSAITSIVARHWVNLCSPWYQIRSAVGSLGRQEPILGGYGGIVSQNDSGSCQLPATEMQSTQWWAGCKAWDLTNRIRKLLACVWLLTLRFFLKHQCWVGPLSGVALEGCVWFTEVQ